MQDGDYKYVFVCGLARSGTSVLGRNIARLENCTGFANTGAGSDEGQFLQGVYPIAAVYGGAGRFGFDPRAHRTETSELFTPENVARLRASWHAYWDKSKKICVEKTPGNLLMTRFLQAAFPNSYFVVIRRHPVPVSMSTQRWKINLTSLRSLFEHWLHCHTLFEEDKRYLRHVYEVRYEDYVEDPDKYHQEIARFIGTRVLEPPSEDNYRYVTQWANPTGLRVPECGMEKTSRAYDKKYFDRWSKLLNNSLFKSYYRYIAIRYEPLFARYGYSLTEDSGAGKQVLQGSKVSNSVGALYCVAADAGAFLRRLSVRSNERLRDAAKTVLPELVVTKIRQARKKNQISVVRT
jgi:hypothetical protein